MTDKFIYCNNSKCDKRKRCKRYMSLIRKSGSLRGDNESKPKEQNVQRFAPASIRGKGKVCYKYIEI